MGKKISIIIGTRPEAIKLSPLILAIRNNSNYKLNVCVTGQHREMLDQVLDIFDIIPNVDLNLMQKNQTLASFTSRAIQVINEYLKECSPDILFIQGDTTTVLCSALSAYYNQIPVGHVEAGLRTGNKYSPFPEEINRKVTTSIAEYHFAPTITSKENLLNEGIHNNKIFVTGNTVIDAIEYSKNKIKSNNNFSNLVPELAHIKKDKKIVLITGHRRENIGIGLESICSAILKLSQLFPNVDFVYPVHLNPNVQKIVFQNLSDKDNIFLLPPLGYLPFIALMVRSFLILTDSGGIQEEAPSLGKPVLVTRNTTERPEAVKMGTAKLVGTEKKNIINSVTKLLTNQNKYNNMVNKINPYGDGKAALKILKIMSDIM